MNIIVCLKQIPNPDLQFQITSDGLDIKRDALTYKVSGADEYALEEAVRLKERHGGRVTALTLGPKRSEQMLREALAKGADEAVRIADENPMIQDVGRTARALAAAIRTIPYDAILVGVQSDDHINSATGGLLAGLLGLAHGSVVTRVGWKDGTFEIEMELEGGLLRLYSLPTPAVLTIQFGANTPRYAPLPAIMRAARQPIRELGAQALGLPGFDGLSLPYSFAVRRLSPPASKGRATMTTGPIPEQARILAQLLRDRGLVRR